MAIIILIDLINSILKNLVFNKNLLINNASECRNIHKIVCLCGQSETKQYNSTCLDVLQCVL